MILQCPLPDGSAGVAVRLSAYVDCQSRMLGENGFQTLVGDPAMASILSGLVAIFIALIGYRMILGSPPSLRDGVSLTARLGIVLALVTSWPAFQTLVYHVATDGPEEVATILLPASGLPAMELEDRIQAAYDAIRLGVATDGTAQGAAGTSAGTAASVNAASAPLLSGFAPLPQTASLFVVTTVGIMAALHLIVGFLLAVAPFGILSLLFEGTSGIFNGWVRALVGAALGVLASSVTSAVALTTVEMEVAHMRSAGGVSPVAGDPQALVTVVLCCFLIALGMAYAAFRMAGAFRLPWSQALIMRSGRHEQQTTASAWPPAAAALMTADTSTVARSSAARSRAEGVADTLATVARRDHVLHDMHTASNSPSSRVLNVAASRGETPPLVPLGVAGRRSTYRRTRSAGRRDMAS